MNCSKCNRLLEKDFKFCPECGTPVKTEVDVSENISNEVENDLKNNTVSENSNNSKQRKYNILKTKSKLKKAFLLTMIISLSISALIGIAVILIGNLGETEGKILGTTLALGGFSIIGLCCSTLYEKKNFKIFSLIGMIFCLLGFLQTALLIWEAYGHNQWDWTFKILITFIVVSLSMAQISILFLINFKNKVARNVLYATIGLICIVALMILGLVYEIVDDRTELYVRFLSVFGILDALGTITTPIINKIGSKQ